MAEKPKCEVAVKEQEVALKSTIQVASHEKNI